jgi:hypothetical protein
MVAMTDTRPSQATVEQRGRTAHSLREEYEENLRQFRELLKRIKSIREQMRRLDQPHRIHRTAR